MPVTLTLNLLYPNPPHDLEPFIDPPIATNPPTTDTFWPRWARTRKERGQGNSLE